tara:strand:- start:1089 stop:5075 length:3987 start_codon:yes stop_codon:yes gene_type:complete
MPQIDPKYDRLYLTDEYLTDPLLMALAWKKAHEYIRTTNWYADNFELDKSALNLAKWCRDWTEEICRDDLEFTPLTLVPAPKTAVWEFIGNECSDAKQMLSKEADDIPDTGDPWYCLQWQPKGDIKLRPLAHIGIKEQTIMTLVMMCLANDIEAKQGDPSTKYEDVHKKKVVSYGNRMYCKYHEDDEGKVTAEHNYGATTIYSKYFTDYRMFLQRPYHFASKALPEKSPDEEVYLIELDLEKFFDRINRTKLIEKIEKIAQEAKAVSTKNRNIPETLFQTFKEWEWTDCAKKSYHLCNDSESPPSGLPQGLVASGFLSNIYMLAFDEYMQSCIDKGLPEEFKKELTLSDYCRYVDDMRLVVTGPKRDTNNPQPVKKIQHAINEWLGPKLEKLGLKLNKDKTKVEVFRGKSKGISGALEGVQSNLSGPISLEGADELINQLESLLMLSESKTPDQTGDSCKFNRLALIEKNVFDVREDTLKRFAANKIARVLNEKRHFTSREKDVNGNPIAGDWDYLQERMARRLVACWSHDPALVLLLKKGLELFPSPKLLEPVLEQLRHVKEREKSTNPNLKKQAAVARYCLAEVFRHSSTVIHRKDPQAIPAHADMDGYFELLQDESAKLIRLTPKADDEVKDAVTKEPFDLLLQQARFLLMVRLDTTLEKSCGDAEQDLIFKLANGLRDIHLIRPKSLPEKIRELRIKLEKWNESVSTCILIANQLVKDQKRVILATSCLLDKYPTTAKEILTIIAVQNPYFLQSLFIHARKVKYRWYDNIKTGIVKTISKQLYLDVAPSTKPLNKILGPIGIYQLSSRPDNPLGNEIMALKLILALIKSTDITELTKSKIIDLSRTRVRLMHPTGFSVPPAYSVCDNELLIDKIEVLPAIADMAAHLSPIDTEAMLLQRIALALRAVLAGSADPTGFGQSFVPRAGYRGLKSTSFKRQFGMMTTPESLAGEGAQFSTWLTTLLSKLLRWPGIHVNDQSFDWPREFTFASVKDLIKKRLELLKAAYCQLSEMPVLPELVSPSWSEDKKSLKVAMVQSKLPFKDDFNIASTKLDNPAYREKHRQHVARVAKLVVKHVEAQHTEKCKDGEREQDIDLIIWPELSVHQEDMDILVQLSRKTHAIVLAGLVFIDQPSISGPNNCAVWIVPRKHNGNKNEIKRYQGKFHMMEGERKLNIQSWRPYQLMLELKHPKFKDKPGFNLTSATCFDATDIKLSADLRDKSNALCIPALNTDVGSFDTMVEALHYHMYQPVILVNTGEFGGSYAMAPYKERHKRLIAHSSGNNQVAINTFEMNMFDFRRDGVGKSMLSKDETKTPPAGVPFKDSKK